MLLLGDVCLLSVLNAKKKKKSQLKYSPFLCFWQSIQLLFVFWQFFFLSYIDFSILFKEILPPRSIRLQAMESHVCTNHVSFSLGQSEPKKLNQIYFYHSLESCHLHVYEETL